MVSTDKAIGVPRDSIEGVSAGSSNFGREGLNLGCSVLDFRPEEASNIPIRKSMNLQGPTQALLFLFFETVAYLRLFLYELLESGHTSMYSTPKLAVWNRDN